MSESKNNNSSGAQQAVEQLKQVGTAFWSNYVSSTPQRVLAIDAFLAFAVATGIVQFLYVLVVGQFPFNSFLAGFIACVGFFVFTVCLRLQISNPGDFGGITEERAYADFVVCNALLFFVVVTFMG